MWCGLDVGWGLENPDVVVPCNKAHGAKVMAWVGIVDGQVLPVHWFSSLRIYKCSGQRCGRPSGIEPHRSSTGFNRMERALTAPWMSCLFWNPSLGTGSFPGDRNTTGHLTARTSTLLIFPSGHRLFLT